MPIYNLKQLKPDQIQTYHQAITSAFPPVICASPVSKKYWERLERYFPDFQLFLISSDGVLTIPFHFDADLAALPAEGWDWMLAKGIRDFEEKTTPNYLGGLQVIVRSAFQNLGYSKQILAHCKQVVSASQFQNLVIPIRPTKKHLHPHMSMTDYLDLKEGSTIFDPWIRTHIKGGAEIIKVCERSMTVEGDILFWEKIFNKKLDKSGAYLLKGTLNPVTIDLENGNGCYVEPNIWVKYDTI